MSDLVVRVERIIRANIEAQWSHVLLNGDDRTARAAIAEVLDAELLENIKAAYSKVADAPEFKPDERMRWIELRNAVGELLKYLPRAPT